MLCQFMKTTTLEIVFANHLNYFKQYCLNVTNQTLHAEMHQCHRDLHRWSKATQVNFYSAKESTHILAFAYGNAFNLNLLGVPFDNAQPMRDAVVKLVSEDGWKIASILRRNNLFTNDELVCLCNSHLL